MSMKDWWSDTDSGKTKEFFNHISPHRLAWKWTQVSAVRGRRRTALHCVWRKEKWDRRRKISGVNSAQFRMSGILLPWRQMKNWLRSCFIICMNRRIILLNANPRRFSSERFGWQPEKMLLNSSYRVRFHQIYLPTHQPVYGFSWNSLWIRCHQRRPCHLY